MPQRKVRKPVINNRVRRSSDSQINFTFFKSKMFLALAAIAVIVVAFAIISSANNPNPNAEMSGGQYRIDTSSIQTDPSATNVVTQ